ncbi:hypothetical protein JCM19237_6700 [Photobacterium aphoticum]|uniref:Uncharacterized protein n=1 Tax=Photobacterium aphoticum TaxID=754436 RepID=A0A090QLJ4_9GAMM|nr:hypothetical protein JCM19237_6700 [Photobacterium aphoticum]
MVLRKHMKISDYNLNDPDEYGAAITEAATIMVDTPDDEIIGLSKRDANAMGKFDQVNSEALEKLLTDKDSAFSLAMAYRLAKKEKSTPKALMEQQEKEKEAKEKAAESNNTESKDTPEKNKKEKDSDKAKASSDADNDQPNAINETTAQ